MSYFCFDKPFASKIHFTAPVQVLGFKQFHISKGYKHQIRANVPTTISGITVF